MKKIFKYELAITDRQNLTMPAGAQILTVQLQNEKVQLWALVSEDNPPKVHNIECYGTGHPIDKPNFLVHIASVQTNGGQFIWHFFERP